ncbi:hypothetical protein A2U01_0085514, partial [Trifolium medium]|nr:hypothetical protein [Trifolium medium]
VDILVHVESEVVVVLALVEFEVIVVVLALVEFEVFVVVLALVEFEVVVEVDHLRCLG